jgi:hypothetical protein
MGCQLVLLMVVLLSHTALLAAHAALSSSESYRLRVVIDSQCYTVNKSVRKLLSNGTTACTSICKQVSVCTQLHRNKVTQRQQQQSSHVNCTHSRGPLQRCTQHGSAQHARVLASRTAAVHTATRCYNIESACTDLLRLRHQHCVCCPVAADYTVQCCC